MEKKEVDTAVNRLAEATERLNKTIDKMVAVILMSICSMAICCIILSIVAIFM